MRNYEMIVILRADLAEDDLANQLDTIQGWVERAGGEISELNHWGRRRMAYRIQNQRDGYYLLYKLRLDPDAPAEIERTLRIDENILRYLIVRDDE